MREDLIMTLAEGITMVMILSIVIGLVVGWYFTYLYYHRHNPEVTDLAKRLPPSQLPAPPPPHDKCQDCDNKKGCVTCQDGDQYERTENTDDVFAAFTKEYMEKYDDEIVCVYDRYAGLVDGIRWQRDQLLKDELDGEVTHGKNLTIPSLAYFLDRNDMAYGDKVKVIIIKKD